MQSHPTIWHNRRFLLLLCSFSISLFGNTFHSIALNLWVLQTTGSAKMMAVITVANLLLSSLLGSIAGTLADRWNRKSIMLVADLVSCCILLALAYVISLQQVPFLLIVVMTGLVTVCSLFQSPAYQSSIVNVVGKEHVQKAVGILNLSENICRTVGFSAGGAFVYAYGAPTAILFDGVTFLISFLLVLCVGAIPMPVRVNAPPREERKFIQDLADGIRYVWKFPFARSVVVMLPVLTMLFMPSLMLMQVMAVKNWNASPFQFGLMEACIPLGYMIGSGMILLLGDRLKRRGLIIMLGLFLMGPLYILLSLVDSATPAIPIILLIGLVFSLCTLFINTILRLEVTEELQGRVFGVLGSIMSFAPSVGLTAFSFLSDSFTPALVMAVIGSLLLLFAITSWHGFKVIRDYR
ncbi:MFS transporter [Paenibacillus herberti]|uniref:MFS transporter n=2 Tax=Paenibacillus herberti TaxID=1619309 RepID=A0A229P5A1_9BACL|nr:MFS transporter [Paenibacillus herberti]